MEEAHLDTFLDPMCSPNIEDGLFDCNYFPADDEIFLVDCNRDKVLMDFLSSEFDIIPINPAVDYESETGSEADLEQEFEDELMIPEPCVNETNSSTNVIAGNDKDINRNSVTVSEFTCDNNSNSLDSSFKKVEDGESIQQSSAKKVKKKLNLQEYKQLRGNPNMTCSLKDVKDTLMEELKSNGELPTSLPPIPLPNLNGNGYTDGKHQSMQETQEIEMQEVPADNPENYEEIIIVSMGCNTDLTIPIAQDCPELNADDETIENESKTLKNIVNNLKKDNKQNILLSHTTLLASIQNIVTKQKQTPPASAPCSLEIEYKVNKEEDHGEDKVIMHLRKDRARPEMKSIETQTVCLMQFPPLNNLWIKKSVTNKTHSAAHIERTQKNYRKRRNSNERDDGGSRTSRSRSRSRSSNRNYVSAVISHRQRKNSQRNKSLSSSMYSSESDESDSDYSSSRRRSHRSKSRSISVSSYSSTDSSSSSDSSSSTSYDRDRSRRGQRRRNYSYRSNRSNRTRSRSRDSYYRRRSNSSRRSTSSSRYRRSVSRQNLKNNNNNNNKMNVDPDNRNVIYVGHLEEKITKADLRRKFNSYGQISKITIHFKDTGMKYGFITFQKVECAYAAIDSSAKDSNISHYDVCFGGRRAFCRQEYCDLDNERGTPVDPVQPNAPAPVVNTGEMSFEALLELTKQKLSERQRTS